ncbi:hypothetical protein RB599_005399 [Gaeumannomyces hyphopodioides]
MAGLGEQPDFAVVQANSETIGRQFGPFANLPGIAAAGAIVEQLGQIQRTLGRIKEQITELKTLIIASNSNMMARSLNANVPPGQTLQPLRDPVTNDEIPHFPETLEDIDRMDCKIPVFALMGLHYTNVWAAQDLGAVLSALGLPAGGNVVVKRKRLRAATGFVLYTQ